MDVVPEPKASSSLQVISRKAHKYEVSLNRKSFRLLTLLPGNKVDDIKCELKVLKIAGAPLYEALSYVWGSSERNSTLICNDMSMDITNNLDSALRTLRSSSHSRVLWVDQVCIDQQSDRERSEQVQSMGQIYSGARKVLMWLGEDELQKAPAAISLVFDLACVDVGPGLSSHLPTAPLFPKDSELKKFGLPPRASLGWRAFQNMLELPYFTRIWIIQEIRLAKSVTTIWGTFELSWDIIVRALGVARVLNLCYDDRNLEDPASGLRFFKAGPLLSRRVSASWTNLCLLTKFSYNATDPRDRVYALISLADDDARLEANYSLTTEEVYARATNHIMKSSQQLGLLSFTHSKCPTFPNELPSWADCWSKKALDNVTVGFMGLGFRAAKDSKANLRKMSDWRILVIDGFSIGHVTHIGPPFGRKTLGRRDFVESFQFLLQNAQEIKEKHGVPMIELLLSCVTCSFEWTNEGDTRFTDNQKYLLRSFCAYIHYDVVRQIVRSRVEGAELSCLRGTLELVDLALAADASMTPNQGQQTWSQDTYDRVEQLMALHHPSNPRAAQTAAESLFLLRSLEDQNLFQRFEAIVVRASEGRKLFITSQGELGMGPACLEEDDTISLLFGGDTFFALRPIPGTKEYHFLGECYVHGQMGGKAMEEYERGGYDLESFSLR